MSYPRNAASPEPIAIGAVIQISDGAVQTSGVTVRIKPIGVGEGDGGGSTAYSTDGIVLYTPTQAETNYTSFVLIAKKTGCIPVAITVVTSASATAGYAGLDWSKVTNPTTTVGLSGTTIGFVTDVSQVSGDVLGDVWGDLRGSVKQHVEGNVMGSLMGDVQGIVFTIGAGAIGTTSMASGAISAAVLSDEAIAAIQEDMATEAELATAIITGLTTALTEGYRATNATGSVRDLLYEILQNLTEFGLVGTTKTVRKINGSTTAKTYTLNSPTAPTAITEAT